MHPGAGIWGQVWAPAKAFIILGECSFQIVSFCFPTPPNLCKNKLREFNVRFQGPLMSNFLVSVRAGTNPTWWLADAWPEPGGAGCSLRTCPVHCRCDGHPSKGYHSILPATRGTDRSHFTEGNLRVWNRYEVTQLTRGSAETRACWSPTLCTSPLCLTLNLPVLHSGRGVLDTMKTMATPFQV